MTLKFKFLNYRYQITLFAFRKKLPAPKLAVGTLVTYDRNCEKNTGILAFIEDNSKYPKSYIIRSQYNNTIYPVPVDAVDVNAYEVNRYTALIINE